MFVSIISNTEHFFFYIMEKIELKKKLKKKYSMTLVLVVPVFSSTTHTSDMRMDLPAFL